MPETLHTGIQIFDKYPPPPLFPFNAQSALHRIVQFNIFKGTSHKNNYAVQSVENCEVAVT